MSLKEGWDLSVVKYVESPSQIIDIMACFTTYLKILSDQNSLNNYEKNI